jgi:hypothetical protein
MAALPYSQHPSAQVDGEPSIVLHECANAASQQFVLGANREAPTQFGCGTLLLQKIAVLQQPVGAGVGADVGAGVGAVVGAGVGAGVGHVIGAPVLNSKMPALHWPFVLNIDVQQSGWLASKFGLLIPPH